MAFMVHHPKFDDFDDFKSLFDADPVGRKQAAKGHLMLRSLDNPNEVFTRVEFDLVEDAQAFRDRLVASGALDRATVLTPRQSWSWSRTSRTSGPRRHLPNVGATTRALREGFIVVRTAIGRGGLKMHKAPGSEASSPA